MLEKDPCWWTNGFWAGLMWLVYCGTNNEQYKKVAVHAENMLDSAFKSFDGLHHDVGFMWHISSGVNYRLTKNKNSKIRAMIAANLLAGRYNPRGNYIRSWNYHEGGNDNAGWVIIDSMMNINLLYWASEETHDERYKYMAMNHADNTIKSHIREDGSVNHIVNLDVASGEPLESFGGQGYENGSSWSRGQSWAIYGYVLSYIHTKKDEYLNTAKKVAHYFISNLADDYTPVVDFRAPREPKIYDTTAGTCAACGLIEIANCVGDTEKYLYLNAAIKILKSLEKEHCSWSLDEDSVLQDGTEAYHNRDGRHIPIIYGDYFFAEAVYKLKGFKPLFW